LLWACDIINHVTLIPCIRCPTGVIGVPWNRHCICKTATDFEILRLIRIEVTTSRDAFVHVII